MDLMSEILLSRWLSCAMSFFSKKPKDAASSPAAAESPSQMKGLKGDEMKDMPRGALKQWEEERSKLKGKFLEKKETLKMEVEMAERKDPHWLERFYVGEFKDLETGVVKEEIDLRARFKGDCMPKEISETLEERRGLLCL